MPKVVGTALNLFSYYIFLLLLTHFSPPNFILLVLDNLGSEGYILLPPGSNHILYSATTSAEALVKIYNTMNKHYTLLCCADVQFGSVTGSGGKELLNGKKKRMCVLVHSYSVVKVLLAFLLSAKVKDNVKCLVNL